MGQPITKASHQKQIVTNCNGSIHSGMKFGHLSQSRTLRLDLELEMIQDRH